MVIPRRGVITFPLSIAHRFAHVRDSSRRATGATRCAARALYRDLTEPATRAETLMAQHARTFQFAARFFPTDLRRDTVHLYAFFRTIDDLVDESELARCEPDRVLAELDEWQSWFNGGMRQVPPRADIGVPLKRVISVNAIPVEHFLFFLDGMSADLDSMPVTSRSDVERYSRQVASTVGLAMARIFGATSSRALIAAEELGIAMQLTNILRDVGGDLARGRLYLPADLLDRHGLQREDVERMWRSGKPPDDRLRGALSEMVSWADEYYARGAAGVDLLPEPACLPVLVASRLYQRILRQLERNGYDSLNARVTTSRWQKLHTLSSCVLRPEVNGLDADALAPDETSGELSLPEVE